MRFRIHGTVRRASGEEFEDSLIVEGDSIEELRQQVEEETTNRGWVDCWSEEI